MYTWSLKQVLLVNVLFPQNAVLTEQQSIMGQCMEERKALATERAQFAAARREWEAKMKEEMSKASQVQGDTTFAPATIFQALFHLRCRVRIAIRFSCRFRY